MMTTCIVMLLSTICGQQVRQAPSARVIQIPEVTREISDDTRAEWTDRCQPRLVRDNYGVGRWTYKLPGCEYGP